MGALTFADLKARVRSRFGENDAWDASTNWYGVWVNSAYRYLATLEKVSETKRHVFIPDLETSVSSNTTASQGYVIEPTDVLIVREIYDATNNKRLDWMSWQDWVGKTDKATNTGKPTYWNRRGGYINLYPTPDATYALTIYYKKVVADLSGASDVTILGAEWDDVVVELAHYFGRMHSNEYDRAEISMKAAKQKIIELMDAYPSEERARRERVQPDSQMTWKSTY